MLKQLLDWVTVLKESEEEQAANRLWLQAMILIALAIVVLYGVFGWQTGQGLEVSLFFVGLGGIFIFLLFVLRAGHISRVAASFGLFSLFGTLYTTYHFGGVQGSSYFGVIVALVIFAIFLRGRATIAATTAAILYGGVLLLGESMGWYKTDQAYNTPLLIWLGASTIFIVTALLVGIASHTARKLFESEKLEVQERGKAETVLQEQTRYLAALHETTLAIINRLEIDPLLGSILQSALELTGTEHGYIDMYTTEEYNVITRAGHGVFSQWVNSRKKIDRGVSGHVFKTGTTLVLSDYSAWPGHIPEYISGFYAIVSVPMKVRGDIIGIIGLGYTEAGREFSQSQVTALEQFAELAALAVDNARLYQSAQDELQERKRIQGALTESDENLRLALDAAQMGIWRWNILTNDVVWSNTVYELFGVKKDELELNYPGYLNFIHPEDRANVERKINQSRKNPGIFYFVEHRIIKPDGGICWISTQGRVYTDEHGNPVRMVGIMGDITERKLSEEALRQANLQLENNALVLERRSQLLQVAAKVSQAASAILDSDKLSQQVVELVQQRFRLYYVGLFLADEIGENLHLSAATGQAGREMLLHGHKLPIGNTSMVGWCVAHRRARIALDVGVDAVHFSNPLLPSTRSELALPLISRGQVLGALTFQSEYEAAFSDEDIETFQTMTDQLANAILNARLYDQLQQELEVRKRAEEKVRRLNKELEQRVERRTLALKASEEKFRALADNNPLRIRRYDREARYLYANSVSAIPDFEPEFIIGKTIREVVDNPELVELAERCIRQVFDTGQPMHTEYQFDENSYALWWLAPEFGPDGKVISVVTTTLDISERRQMEDELRARSLELQASNRELESFSYSVSHDLRAPLRALDGFSQILLEDFHDSLPDDGKHYLNRIREAAQQMSQLIDDMLRLSRITRAEMRHDPVDLTGIANRIIETLKNHEPERAVAVNVHENLVVNGDEGLLRMAMENMLNNAWKFSAKNERSEIEVGKIKLKEKEAFFIRDNGVGFDMAYADKLFAVFQRLHSPKEFPGTGIGLAIAQRVIHRHGGKIWAEGELGKGATFYFTL